MKARLVGYIRVSTKRQGQSGLGLEAQLNALECHARAVNGELVAIYREVESGKNDRRPELEKAIQHCRAVKAQLVISKLDRLSRNLLFIATMIEAKVDFIALDVPSASPLMLHVMGAFAQHEREMISQRVKAALQAAKARGVKLGQKTGEYVKRVQREGSKIGRAVIQNNCREHYSFVLPQVRELKQSGKSLVQIAEHLNSQGFKTRMDKPFSPTAVFRLLKRVPA